MRKWLSKLVGRKVRETQLADSHLQREIYDLIRLIPQARAEDTAEIDHLGQTLYRVGLDRLQAGLPAQAALALSTAIDLNISEPYLDYNLALAYSRSGQAADAHRYFEAAFNGPHTDIAGDGYYLRNLHALDDVSLKTLYKEAGRWAKKHVKHGARKGAARARQRKDKLRVGLLSARFSRHAVGFLTLGGLEQVDPTRVELMLYANASPQDDYTTRFQALASAWHDITDLDDAAAAGLMASHDLDILIDMAGHSGGGRMGVVARKPAPVQAKWAGGQHGTTGITAFDYFITDSIETPVGDERYFYETPARLPHAYACYTPPPDAPPVASLPLKSRSYVTFGSFNNIAKIGKRTIEVWARILNTVSNSRLVLKHLALAEEDARDRLASQFSAYGVMPSRLDMRAPTDQVSHLESYADIDIALDPFPWSGCVTTCESLWMGVPVLALPGVAFCHRHSASFLNAVGLNEWVAKDAEDYVAKAIEFSQQVEVVETLRSNMRDRVHSSPLCDGVTFARDFEDLLSRMWIGDLKNKP